MPAVMDEQQLINHLMFHKAMVGLDGDGTAAPERVDEYIRLAKEAGEGQHVGIEDPFDRSIALAFELVLQQGLDPWAIDLVKFSSLYAERVREGAEVDLITAGKLLHMAWSILRMQSDVLRQAAEPPVESGYEDMGWDEMPQWDDLPDDIDVAYTSRVIQSKLDIIDEKVRHKGDRKVTLMELVEALEQARAEADQRALVLEARERERANRRTATRGRTRNAAHKDDQDADNREVLERILAYQGERVPIVDIHARNRDDLVKTFVSVLFLARSKRVRVWQEDFPYGMIYVTPEAAIDADSAEGDDKPAGTSAEDAIIAATITK